MDTLKTLINSKALLTIMEAHNGLSARLVERAGFSAIWASGLSIATSLGVRDCNELTATQVLMVLEFMVDSVNIPILVDGETGFGDFNNARLFTRKLCSLGLKGVCFEDKIFPKINSFSDHKQQKLENVDVFCGKLCASLDSRTHSDFLIVARVESLIAGESMEQALYRAERYADCGVDAIFIHSKQSTASEIIEFSHKWKKNIPLIIAPTTYYATKFEEFLAAGVTNIIFANHSLRASYQSIDKICKLAIANKTQSMQLLEENVANIHDIFSLLDYEELKEAEKKYITIR